MEIETVDIESVKPYSRNAKEHPPKQVKQIARSIQEFGFNDPIAIDENGTIIEGHGRLLAAQKLRMKTIPIIRLDHLTEPQKRAYIIAHNKLTMNTGFDLDVLRLELADLQGMDFDLSLTGFDLTEVSDYLKGLGDITEPEGDPDEVPEVPQEPVTRLGDLYELGGHRLLCGNATNTQDVATLLNWETPLLMVTDPPYGVEYDPEWRNEADRANGKPYGARAIGKVSNDDRNDWREAWALFTGNIAYVWHADRHAKTVQKSLEFQGFKIRNQVIWAKNNFAISRGDYHWQHEPCWYAIRNEGTSHWTGDRSQTTLWQIDTPLKSETGHSTQKPVECMARAIRNHGLPGNLVYDPFLGSGTTMVAAELNQRRCFGLEIEPLYCDIIVARMKKVFPEIQVKRNGETI